MSYYWFLLLAGYVIPAIIVSLVVGKILHNNDKHNQEN